ncbi:MAG: AmpG family muropeptide MFS transporter [Nitrospirota bacterium]|nr:AmpG family muropeptide MFS transporter [Nitrospirota bacterium]
MNTPNQPAHWLENFLTLLLGPKMLVMLLTGFSSGLPLLLTGSTLKFWMREEGLDLTTIGFFGLVGLPYTLKFLWAPFMDRIVPPFGGRRRGWMLVTQLVLMVSIASLALTKPSIHLSTIVFLSLFVAFFSASQDIVLDAYRREYLPDEELGIGSSIFVNGYRLGNLVSGALALILADYLSWSSAYVVMGLFMLIGIVTTWYAPEPTIEASPPTSFQEAFTSPFLEFIRRPEWISILLFILLYKIGDSMASEMLAPFWVDLDVSKSTVAGIVKTFGLTASIGGGVLAGLVVYRWGIVPSLLIFGFLQMISTAGFALLAIVGNHLILLTVVIAFENLTGGMGTTAFVAFMASLTDKRFTATQYALLTSFMGIPRVFAGATTGFLASWLGWEGFFLLCTILAVPGLLLIAKLRRLTPLPTGHKTSDL